jgi:predicted metalloprotease
MIGPAETKDREPAARPRPTMTAPRGVRRMGHSQKRAILVLLIVSGMVALVALLWQFVDLRRSGETLPPISPERALLVARRVGIVFDDGEQTWSSWFRSKGMEAPQPAEVVLFSNARPTPCSSTSPVGGPFYCPLDDKASYDLVLLNQLEKRMDRQAGLGTALVVARVHAEHIQTALGVPPSVSASSANFSRQHTLHADCLAGAWAGLAKSRISAVPPGFYSQLLNRGRLLMEMYVNGGRPDQPALDMFLLDDLQAREAAFQQGLLSRDAFACPRPS